MGRLLFSVIVATCALATIAHGADVPATQRIEKGKSLKECIGPAVKNGGFVMEGFFIWCSSVIKVGDTYHLFASRWPAEHGLGGWTKYSECVRATSKQLL